MKIYLSVLLWLLTFYRNLLSQADFAPKTFLLSATLGASQNQSTEKQNLYSPYLQQSSLVNINTKTTSLYASPRIMYFILHNFAIGIQNQSTYNKIESNYRTEYTTISYGPVLRYYLSCGIFAYGGVSRLITHQKLVSYYNQASGGIGYCKMLGPHIGIEPTVTYTYTTFSKLKNFHQEDLIQKSHLTQFGVGVSFFLRKEKLATK